MTRGTRYDLSARARAILDALRSWPRTAEELARETKLPVDAVDVALLELRTEGRATELNTGVWWLA